MRRLARLLACLVMLYGTWPVSLEAQTPVATTGAQTFNTEQLDALLAPIALYPDALLTQVLMASTYPLQVVEASRWVEQPANKSLSGDVLTKALAERSWDPSVKSLVPFPQVLAMMNENLEWTQQLGYAVADQEGAVIDSVQRLRRQAQSHGALQSGTQQVVRSEQQTIIIEPAQTNVVYVPSYNPTVVYGSWPYPTYPPVYLPPPVAYPVGAALVSGIAFGVGVGITAGLWNWARPVWPTPYHGGYFNVNVNRYNYINVNRTAIASERWQPNRTGGRPAGLARPPNGPVGMPARPSGLPANAIGRPQVSVPGNAVRPGQNIQQGGTGNGPTIGQGNRPVINQPPGNRLGQGGTGTRPVLGQGNRFDTNRPAGNRPGQQGAFGGIENGRRASEFAQRGEQSRAAARTDRFVPRGGQAGERRGAPRGGGGIGRRG